jgi:predicted Zn-ribbon and HTH transcriptional regulator
MSFIIYKVKCKKCGYRFNSAFGIVGMRIIAEPAKRCPKCKAVIREGLKTVRHKRKLNCRSGS